MSQPPAAPPGAQPSPTPALSVVVPTFRRPQLLAAALAATLAQMRAAGPGLAEAIVVDNCPDRSAEAAVAATGAATGAPAGLLRYVHEAQPGVAHARNAGVAAARGGHVLFLDDDETPAPGWLDAFAAAAAAGGDAVFGRIAARYGAEAPASRRALLDRLFVRDLGRPDGADITDAWVRLGTGNALFRTALLDGGRTFDPRFNRTGGEDMNLIRRLLARGVRLRWAQHGLVEEIVPAERMTPDYLARRRFTQGQLRCLLIAVEGGRLAPARLGFWMAAGAAQATVCGVRAALARAGGADPEPWRARMQGGLGKLFWRRRATALDYGGAAAHPPA